MTRLSKNVENHANLKFHNSVRPDWPSAGPVKLRTIFPLISVLPKPPQLQYWAIFVSRRGPIEFHIDEVVGVLFGLGEDIQ